MCMHDVTDSVWTEEEDNDDGEDDWNEREMHIMHTSKINIDHYIGNK